MAGTASEVLWRPSPQRVAGARITAYQAWLEQHRGLSFDSYDALQRWSVADLGGFWGSILEFTGIEAAGDHRPAVEDEHLLPGARWFPDVRLNYAGRALAGEAGREAIVACSESGGRRVLTLGEVRTRVAEVAAGLQERGVGVGDRVAGYLPNTSETVIAFLASASLGAVWSGCAPEFGARSVIDRFSQIAPKALVAAASYAYGGRTFDRRAELEAIRAALPSLDVTILTGSAGSTPTGGVAWEDFGRAGAPFAPEPVPFEHPLWIVYSSGTTGLPKPIVHSHGGIVLEHVKGHGLHLDLAPGDRFFWYSGTGWVMWNLLVGGLLVDATIVLYDGSPAYPDSRALWSLAEHTRCTLFGVGAPLLEAMLREGQRPAAEFDLTALRTIGSTGAPLGADAYRWVYREVADDGLLASISGGTDIATAFVGSVPTLPVRAGEIQGRWLGAAVEAYDTDGRPVVGQPGELVVTRPMPSMPVRFWGDQDGSRYRDAYFAYFPGVWRHGDWITFEPEGGCVVSGRSDSTLKRAGVRMGTADLYQVVEALPEVADSLAVDTTGPGGSGELVLFVVLAPGVGPDARVPESVRTAVRRALSPRHVPDHVVEVAAVPRTLNGKKLEVPVKQVLLGRSPSDVANPDSLLDAGALAGLVEAARAAGLVGGERQPS